MQLSTWIYPWDVAALGVDNVLAELNELGIHSLDLTSTYHPISALSVRGQGRRVMYTEHGAVYFPARAERYERIRPQLWPDPDVMRVWPRIAERVEAYGLSLNAWTIGMFQPWIAHAYPDCAAVMPTGDRIYARTCPAAPDVQAYVAALCADLASQYPLDLIELEGIAYPSFIYGWVRPRILAQLAPWTEWLLGLCFCENCVRRASGRGVDVAALRERVLAETQRSFDAPGDVDPAGSLEERRAAWLAQDRDLNVFVATREDAVVDLVERAAQAVTAVSKTCRIGVWSPVEADGTPGVRLDRVLNSVGAILVWKPIQRLAEAALIKALASTAKHPIVLTHFQAVGWPHGVESPELRHELEAAIALSVDRISFYNYGLIRRGQLIRLVELTNELVAARAAPPALG